MTLNPMNPVFVHRGRGNRVAKLQDEWAHTCKDKPYKLMAETPIRGYQDVCLASFDTFNLIQNTVPDPTRLRQKQEAIEQAAADTLAANLTMPAVSEPPDGDIAAACGCTKFKLCRVALGLSKSVRNQIPGAASAYSDHRNQAINEIETQTKGVTV